MKKIMNIVIGGIEQKIVNLVLVTILLMVGAYTAVILYQAKNIGDLVTTTNERQGNSIVQISDRTMESVVSGSLGRSTQMQSNIADNMFREVKDEVRMLGDYAEKLFSNPDAYEAREYFLPDMNKEGTISVKVMAEEDADLSDPAIAEGLGLIANMTDFMEMLYANARINSCFVVLPSGVGLIADDRSAEKIAESGDMVPIPMRERPWYKGAVETGELYFSDVEKDTFSLNIGIVCAEPVYRNGELVAVVGADLFLDEMEQGVATAAQEGGFVCVINDEGHVVFSSKDSGVFRVTTSEKALDLRQSSNFMLSGFIKDAMKENTEVRLVAADGIEYYMTGAPMQTVGWTMVSAISKEVVDRPTVAMKDSYEAILGGATETFRKDLSYARQTIIVLLGAICLLGLAASIIVAKRIVKPLGKITQRVQSLGGDNLLFKMEDSYRTGDEIEVLAESFSKLSAKTLQYVDEVTKVTAEKERISAELGMATSSQASQLPHLFPAFPDRHEFDIYASMTPAREVGGDFYDFFLVDHDHIALVMADVSGKGVPAALFMMISKILIRNRVQNGESPAQALANVNNQLLEGNEAELFVTVWLAVLEISTGKGVVANAGHEHPTLRRSNGKYELITYRHSPAVATFEGLSFKEHTFELEPGDSLFVYTDGVAEATNADGELYGTDRLLDALNKDPDASAAGTLKNVMDGIDSFVAGAEQFDDITMLCLKYNGPQG